MQSTSQQHVMFDCTIVLDLVWQLFAGPAARSHTAICSDAMLVVLVL